MPPADADREADGAGPSSEAGMLRALSLRVWARLERAAEAWRDWRRQRDGETADVVSFVLQPRSGREVVDVFEAMRPQDTDALLEVLCDALQHVPRDTLVPHRRRLQDLLRGVEDPHGREAFALTVLVSACEYALLLRPSPGHDFRPPSGT